MTPPRWTAEQLRAAAAEACGSDHPDDVEMATSTFNDMLDVLERLEDVTEPVNLTPDENYVLDPSKPVRFKLTVERLAALLTEYYGVEHGEGNAAQAAAWLLPRLAAPAGSEIRLPDPFIERVCRAADAMSDSDSVVRVMLTAFEASSIRRWRAAPEETT